MFLVGCATAPAPPPLQAGLPPRYGATPAEAPLPLAALSTWWTLYHDPQLDALERQALSQAPDAEAAAARLREAQATLATALTPFNPQGGITASGATQNTELASGDVDLAGLPPEGAAGGAGPDRQLRRRIRRQLGD